MIETFMGEIGAAAAVGLASVVVYYMRRLLKIARFIQSEFSPNGGNSMRDQISQLKTLVGSLISLTRLRDDFDHGPIFEADANGNYVRVNRALQALTGRPSESLLGSEWENAICEHDRDRVWEAWVDAIARGRTFEAQFCLRGDDGLTYTIDCVASPIRDGVAVSGWLGKYRSVTPQVQQRRPRAGAGLRESARG